jgi:hypothetical protein
VRRVSPGSQLVVLVDARVPGEVAIPRLGRTASVTATAPARFDLLAPDPGRYDVLFTPTSGEPARTGTLVSRVRR